MTTLPNQTSPGLQQPTFDISGRVLYKSGAWGSRYPVRRVMLSLRMVDATTNTTSGVGNTTTDLDGKFRIKSGFITNSFSKISLQVWDMSTDDTFELVLFPGLVPNSGPQPINDVIFPFEPAHPELARINSVPFKENQKLVKGLSDFLKTPRYPLTIELTSEWRGLVPKIPIGQGLDEPNRRITAVNGKQLDKPVPVKMPEDVASQNRQLGRQLREINKKYDRQITVITPAQKLLHMLNDADFTKDLPERTVKQIFLHGLVSGKTGGTVDSVIKILDSLSLVTISQLETTDILRRLNASMQRAAKNTFYFDTVIEEAAADMAAASVLIFLAGLAAKDRVNPRISINYSFFFPSAGADDLRPYMKLTIQIMKKK